MLICLLCTCIFFVGNRAVRMSFFLHMYISWYKLYWLFNGFEMFAWFVKVGCIFYYNWKWLKTIEFFLIITISILRFFSLLQIVWQNSKWKVTKVHTCIKSSERKIGMFKRTRSIFQFHINMWTLASMDINICQVPSRYQRRASSYRQEQSSTVRYR